MNISMTMNCRRWPQRCLPLLAVLIATPAVAQGNANAATADTAAVNPLQLSFHHVAASVANLDREAAWYQRVLGFQRSPLVDGGQDFKAYHMTRPGLRIDLIWVRGSARQHRYQGNQEQGWLHLVFEVPDLNAAYRYLRSQGTDVVMQRGEDGTINHLQLHDPEGNEIGLAHD